VQDTLRKSKRFFKDRKGAQRKCKKDDATLRYADRTISDALAGSSNAKPEDGARFRSGCKRTKAGKTCRELFEEAMPDECHFSRTADVKSTDKGDITAKIPDTCRDALKAYTRKVKTCIWEEIYGMTDGLFGEPKKRMAAAIKKSIEDVTKEPLPVQEEQQKRKEMTVALPAGVTKQMCKDQRTKDRLMDDVRKMKDLAHTDVFEVSCSGGTADNAGSSDVKGKQARHADTLQRMLPVMATVMMDDTGGVDGVDDWSNTASFLGGTPYATTPQQVPQATGQSGSSGSVAGNSDTTGNDANTQAVSNTEGATSKKGEKKEKDDDSSAMAGIIAGIAGLLGLGGMAAMYMVKRQPQERRVGVQEDIELKHSYAAGNRDGTVNSTFSSKKEVVETGTI
jgi:hypothetical protein